MSLGNYLNRNKIGGLILIIVIIIAFGFGGFGGGFLSNNQNNIAKINKTNVTSQDLINFINQSGISQEAIRENLEDNIIEELLSGLISTTLLGLEIDDFDIKILIRLINVLEQIEIGLYNQHEGSAIVGQILKEIYIDPVVKTPIQKKEISYEDYKNMKRL